jgi:ankyrin repeat protein
MVRDTCRGWSLMVVVLWAANLAAAGGDVRLVDAVKNGDRKAVRSLLQQRTDVNVPAADGMTSLHWAARRDDAETADLLIRSGANVNATTRYGVTPLSLACTYGSPALIERLLKAGADPRSASPEGETVLMTAARSGKADAVKMLLRDGANVNAVEQWKQQTALMWAAAEGHAAITRMLVEVGANVHARSKAGYTALVFAVRAGQFDTVRALLAAGANANDTVLGRPTAMYGADASRPNEESATSAVVLAIINAHYDVAALLLEHGADPNAPDARGSALHALTWMRRPGRSGVALREPTGTLDSLDLVKTLLAHGANPNARLAWKELRFDRDDQEARLPSNISVGRVYLSLVGATPFFLAAKHGDVALMRVLAATGADPLLPTVQNVTPLQAAAGLGYWDGETPGPLGGTPESERLEAVKLALDLGGDVNAVADFGDIPLEGDGIGMLWDFPKNLERLPDTALGDMRWNGSTALHGAAMTNQPSIIRFLVEKGAKLEVRNKLGWTPLMLAEGVFAGAIAKRSPNSEATLRELMTERHMDPALYSQRSRLTPTGSPRP